MKHIKKIFLGVFLFIAFIGVLNAIYQGVPYSLPSDFPKLETGDLVFNTFTSPQTPAILTATQSIYSHVGMIVLKDGKYIVLDARGSGTTEMLLEDWVNYGLMKRFTVMRYQNGLTDIQKDIILKRIEQDYAKPYDFFFTFSKDMIYCSELPYYAYADAGINIGKIIKVGDLNHDNIFVKKIIKTRWKKHPLCKNLDYEPCVEAIMGQEIISPASITRDPNFHIIYNNYPF